MTHWTNDTREQTSLLAEILLHGSRRPEEALAYARMLLREEEMLGGALTYARFLLADCLRQVAGGEAEARSQIGEILAERSGPDTGDDGMKEAVRRWLTELDRKS